jgi:hypothetical protein
MPRRRSGRVEGDRAKSHRRIPRVDQHVAMSKLESPVPVTQAEAREKQMSNHTDRLRSAPTGPKIMHQATGGEETSTGTSLRSYLEGSLTAPHRQLRYHSTLPYSITLLINVDSVSLGVAV